jgi:hypothetical protein
MLSLLVALVLLLSFCCVGVACAGSLNECIIIQGHGSYSIQVVCRCMCTVSNGYAIVVFRTWWNVPT